MIDKGRIKAHLERIKENRNYLPVIFVLFRLFISPLVTLAVLSSKKKLAISFFLLFIGSVYIEKFLLRKSVSHFRSLFDPVADKLFTNLSFLAFYLLGFIPLWMLLVFVIKDSIMVLGSIIILLKDKQAYFRQSLFGKAAFFFQCIVILALIIDKLDMVLMYIALATTVISGVASLFISQVVVLKKAEFDTYRMSKLLKLSDFVTLLNAFSGLAAILLAVSDLLTAAATMMLAAVFFDFLDGKVARLTARTHDFGKELDSLADTISFGVAPAIFGFSLVQSKLALLSFSIFLFAGILRLARFNVMESKGSFEGMPITMNGIVVPLLFFFHLPLLYYPYVYLILAFLMVSSFEVRKVF